MVEKKVETQAEKNKRIEASLPKGRFTPSADAKKAYDKRTEKRVIAEKSEPVKKSASAAPKVKTSLLGRSDLLSPPAKAELKRATE